MRLPFLKPKPEKIWCPNKSCPVVLIEVDGIAVCPKCGTKLVPASWRITK